MRASRSLALLALVLVSCRSDPVNLPLSRNRDYGPDTPVDPNDLNAFQDMAIGAKHGSITIPIPASAFVQMSGDGQLLSGPASVWYFNGALAKALVCRLNLAVGTRITGVSFFYDRNASGDHVQQALVYTDLPNVAQGTVAAVSGVVDDSVSASGGTGHENPIVYNHVTVAKRSYELSIDVVTGNGHTLFYGGSITIQRE